MTTIAPIKTAFTVQYVRAARTSEVAARVPPVNWVGVTLVSVVACRTTRCTSDAPPYASPSAAVVYTFLSSWARHTRACRYPRKTITVTIT